MGYKESKRLNPLLIFIIAIVYKVYLLTLRKKVVYAPEFQNELDQKNSVLIALWHHDVIALMYFVTKEKVLNMTSVSRDGQFIAQLTEFFGSEAVRGSSRNNSVQALKGFLRVFRKGEMWATIAVDGPRGPKRKAKPGLLEVSRLTQKQIFGASAAYTSTWKLSKTWDQTLIPKPFSKVIYYIGPVAPPVERGADTKDPQLLSSFENAMSRNEEKALGILKQ